ncbi:MAG TPA: FMN-binding protein, partial [Sumerlaeia bacterium]|nr:FMN-binding protein [Sumerlaeia bacterium]
MRGDPHRESTRKPVSISRNVSWAGTGILLFHVGFFTLVTQAVLIREFLVLYLGSEIALGVFYSAWLVWIGIGAALFLPFARKGEGASADWLAAGLAGLPVAALLELAALRWMRTWSGVPAAEIVPLGQMALSTFAATALVGLPAGFVFALACRAATVASEGSPTGRNRATRTALSSAPASSDSSGAGNARGEGVAPREAVSTNRVGLLFGFEALGGFLGGLVHTFGLAGRFSTDQVVWLLTGLVGLHLAVWMGLLLWGRFQGLRAGSLTRTEGGSEPVALALRRNGPAVWLALGALLLLGGLFHLATPMGRARLKEAQSERFTRARSGFEWMAAAESRYQRLELARRAGQYTLFANGKVAVSFPNRIDNRRQVALAMAQCARGAERVLVLGAAEGELLAELLEYPSLEHVDAVALDPRAVDLVSPYQDARAKDALGDRRVRMHFTDPRAFVNRASQDDAYDLVLVNAPDPTSASVNRLFTREFFERARRAMNADGVLVTGVVSAANYQGKEVRDFAGSVVATVRSVFPKVALAPGDWMTVIASVAPDGATVDAEELSRRFRRVRPPSGEFKPEAFATLLPEGQVRAVAERFANVQGPINRDAQPMTYYLATVLWSRFSGSTWTRDALEAVEKQGLALVLISLLSFWLARLFYVALSRDGAGQVRADRFNAWLTVAGLGATGMATSLMLVLAYQSSVGLLYGRIGLLAALFMAGIGAGALLTGRLRESTAPARFLLMISLGLMSVLFLLFRRLLLGDTAWTGAAVMASLPVAGALLGVAFAAAARILRDSGGRTGAWLDAADHAGGALGAIATGSVAIPLLGFGTTALLGATVSAGLFVLNAQAFWLERRRGARREIAEPEPSAIKDRFRPMGWMLAALLVSAYALGARIHYRPAEAKPSFRISPNELAQWSETASWEERAQPFAHWRATDAEGTKAPRVAFATDQTAPDVRGYGGPITLAVDMDGKELRGVRLLDSRETPSYVLGLDAWLRGLDGKPLGRGWELGRDIDGITGATVTCRAVLETLNRSVYAGGVDLLDRNWDPGAYRQESWQRGLLSPVSLTVALCFVLL